MYSRAGACAPISKKPPTPWIARKRNKHCHINTEQELLALKSYYDTYGVPSDWTVLAKHFGVTTYRIVEWINELRDRWVNRTVREWEAARGTRYQLYLKSEHWKRVRLMVWERCRGVCERCLAAGMHNVHHRTYEHLGFEDFHLSDLEGLCRTCHKTEHGVTQ